MRLVSEVVPARPARRTGSPTSLLAPERQEGGLTPGHPALAPHADEPIPLCFASALERVAEALQVEEDVAHAEGDEGLLVPGPEALAADAGHAVRGPGLGGPAATLVRRLPAGVAARAAERLAQGPRPVEYYTTPSGACAVRAGARCAASWLVGRASWLRHTRSRGGQAQEGPREGRHGRSG